MSRCRVNGDGELVPSVKHHVMMIYGEMEMKILPFLNSYWTQLHGHFVLYGLDHSRAEDVDPQKAMKLFLGATKKWDDDKGSE